MYNLDILISYKQTIEIDSNRSYIKFDYTPLSKSVWLMFDEKNNVVLYDYKIYDGYNFYNREDIIINYIVDSEPDYKDDNFKYVNYSECSKYLDCLINSVCKDYDTGEIVYLTKSSLYDDDGKLKDGYEKYLKNLCGFCFMDWSLSEQIKNMIKKSSKIPVQINYWYHPKK